MSDDPFMTQLYVCEGVPSEEKFVPARNRPLGGVPKPDHKTGLWTSTWRPETQDSSWVEWCRGESYHAEEYGDCGRWWLLRVRPHVRIYTVDRLHDLEQLLDWYGRRDLDLLPRFLSQVIDFEAAAKQYDGIHLTEEGQMDTRFSEPNLYGWDCESTLWMRWSFDEVRPFTPAPAPGAAPAGGGSPSRARCGRRVLLPPAESG